VLCNLREKKSELAVATCIEYGRARAYARVVVIPVVGLGTTPCLPGAAARHTQLHSGLKFDAHHKGPTCIVVCLLRAACVFMTAYVRL